MKALPLKLFTALNHRPTNAAFDAMKFEELGVKFGSQFFVL